MVGAAAGVGGKAEDARPIELRDHGRRQLVGDEHAGRIEVLQEIARAPLLAAQVHAQAPRHVVEVALALVQVRILDVVEHRGDLVERALHGPLRVDTLGGDQIRGAADQHRIVEHQQLRVEDGGEIGALQLRDARANLLQLLARALARALECRQLARHALRRNRKANDLSALDRDQRRTERDPRRDANPLQAFHDSSPNPDSTSSMSDCTALASSGPSALIVSVVPRAAASSRMPMMLLPSITFASRVTRICDAKRVAR